MKFTLAHGWGVLSLLSLFLMLPSARAQEVEATKSEILRQAIVTAEKALLPLPPEVVCGPQVIATEVSPSGRSVLIVRQTAPAPDAPAFLTDANDGFDSEANRAFIRSGQAELQVLLWTRGSRRASVLWRRAASEQTGVSALYGVKWLGGTETAIVQIANLPAPRIAPEPAPGDAPPPPETTSLLRINALTRQVETLPMGRTSMVLLASPNAPVLVIRASGLKQLYVVRASGPVEGPLPIPYDEPGGEYAYYQGWMADGKRLWGTFFGKRNENGKHPSRRVTLDVTTNTLADEKPGEVRASVPSPPALGYALHRVPVRLSRGETERGVFALWLEAMPVQTGERSLVAVGVDGRSDLVALTDAILYQQHGTLYVRRLATMAAEGYAAARAAEYKAETLRRAGQIGSSLQSWAELNKGMLPPPDKVLQTLQAGPFGILYQTETFNNPATGLPGFTPSYAALPLTEYPDPSKAKMGYLAGPGGRAAIFLDGHAEWEATPGQEKPR